MHASICDTLSDLVQNSLEAGATRVELDVYTGPDKVSARVTDNGKGMDRATLEKAVEPFYSEAGKHDRRRVGLGLPLPRRIFAHGFWDFEGEKTLTESADTPFVDIAVASNSAVGGECLYTVEANDSTGSRLRRRGRWTGWPSTTTAATANSSGTRSNARIWGSRSTVMVVGTPARPSSWAARRMLHMNG